MKRLKDQSGMSLIEVIAAIGVSTIIGLGLMQSFRSVAVSNRTGQLDLKVQQFWQEMDFILNTPAICSVSLKGINTNPVTGNAAPAPTKLPGNPIQLFRANKNGGKEPQPLAMDPSLNGDAPYYYGNANEISTSSVRITNITPLAGAYKKADLVVELTKLGASYGINKPTKTYTIYFADSGVGSNTLEYCSRDTSFANICQGLGGTINALGKCDVSTDRNTCLRLNGTWDDTKTPPCTFAVDGPGSCASMSGVWATPTPSGSPICKFDLDVNPLDPATACALWGGDWLTVPAPGACDFNQGKKSCKNLGGVWNPFNATCYFPFQSADACAALGGTWTPPSGPCTFPQDSQTICENVLRCRWAPPDCDCSGVTPVPVTPTSPTPTSPTPITPPPASPTPAVCPLSGPTYFGWTCVKTATSCFMPTDFSAFSCSNGNFGQTIPGCVMNCDLSEGCSYTEAICTCTCLPDSVGFD